MTFEELMASAGQHQKDFIQQAVKDMFLSKQFANVDSMAYFYNIVNKNPGLMWEIVARVSLMYENELDKYAKYKEAYIELNNIKAIEEFNKRANLLAHFMDQQSQRAV